MPDPITLSKRAAAFSKGFASDPLTHWPFPTIARQAYGNLAGFRQNLYGSVHESYRRLTGRPTTPESLRSEVHEDARKLRRTGTFMARDWVERDVVNQIERRILEVLNTDAILHSDYMSLLEGEKLAQSVPEIFKVFNPKVVALLESYFGGGFVVNSTTFRLTRHVPDEVRKQGEIYSDHWHNDSIATSGLSLFVLLKDLDLDGGPTAALDIPSTRAVVRGGYTSRGHDSVARSGIEANPGKVEMTGPAGTILIVNVARCLHRAGIPAPGKEREWLQFRLYPCSGPTDASRLRGTKILKYTNGIVQDY